MDNLPDLLSPITVTLDQLLLDPNNPRFSELGEVLNSIPEGRFADEKVQANTYEKMRDPMFDVAELRDTIKAIGFGSAAYSTQRTADGGIDFIAANLNIVPEAFAVPTGCRATIIGQTKRYKDGNIITEKQMREFVGAGLLRKHVLQADGKIAPLTPVIFAFWTTSDFEPNAKKYARDVGLWFMDGHTLATYIHSLGLADMVMALPSVAPTGQAQKPDPTLPIETL